GEPARLAASGLRGTAPAHRSLHDVRHDPAASRFAARGGRDRGDDAGGGGGVRGRSHCRIPQSGALQSRRGPGGAAIPLSGGAGRTMTRDRIELQPAAGTPPVKTSVSGSREIFLVVAVALVDRDGRVLITRRPE